MRRAVRIAVGAVAFAVLAAVEIAGIASHNGIGADFLGTMYRPVQAVAHGVVPYGNPLVPGPLSLSVYPASAFLPFAWLGLLGRTGAVVVWLVLMVAAAVATLRVLGVRDLRCHALWLLTPMMLFTITMGNATTLVIFLAAVTWRYRDRPGMAAASLAAAIALKLYAAPLVVWLVATKRYRAAAYTSIGAPLLILVAWASIGFAGIRRYPSILTANNRVWSSSGPYLQGLVRQLHGSSNIALGVGLVTAAILLAGAWFVSDIGAFTLAACGAIVLSPVAWIGYAGMLVVPLAVASPRWSRAWLLLLGTYSSWYYSPIPYKTPGLSVCTLGLVAAFAAVGLRRGERERPPPRRLARWMPTRPSSVSSAA